MFRTLARYAPQQQIPYIYRNPYKAKRLWPPDFSKLSSKYQFRLERKYKRRAKLKWARPRWMKATKIAQMSSMLVVLVYGVLFADWNNRESAHEPFEGIRSWFFGLTGSIWTNDRDQKEGASNPTKPSS